jgi:hypothetical protein
MLLCHLATLEIANGFPVRTDDVKYCIEGCFAEPRLYYCNKLVTQRGSRTCLLSINLNFVVLHNDR